jgi:hypothetical protein
MMADPEMLNSALALARDGFMVFPLVYGTKIPPMDSRGFYYYCVINFVMAGLVPAIHVFSAPEKGVDARDKRGHDDV